jgi:hypothetical protein
MEITARFQTDASTVLRSYRACHPTAVPTRLAVGLLGAVASVCTRSPFPLIMAVAFIALLVASVRIQLRRYLSGTRTVQVLINDDGYQVAGQEGSTKSFSWSAIKSVRRRSGFWVLRISVVRAIGLPADALDAERTAMFVEFLRSKGLLRESISEPLERG